MPDERNPKRMPKPRKIDDSMLIVSSLMMIDSFCPLFLDTSNTKNQAANDIPMIRRIAARCG